MAEIELKLSDGSVVNFAVDEQNQTGPFFVLGVRKSGSSVLNEMVAALSISQGVRFVDVGGNFFDANIMVDNWQNDPAIIPLVRKGNVYGGFRDMPNALQHCELFRGAPKILLVRDPRDALVSEYFSNAYSHHVPEAADGKESVTKHMLTLREAALSTPIDSYVLASAKSFNRTLQQFSSLVYDNRAIIFKYEDFIFEKMQHTRVLCKHFDWNIHEDVIENIVSAADVFPTFENESAFIRHVTPGDHKVKLRPETIEELNYILAPSMSAFGYS